MPKKDEIKFDAHGSAYRWDGQRWVAASHDEVPSWEIKSAKPKSPPPGPVTVEIKVK